MSLEDPMDALGSHGVSFGLPWGSHGCLGFPWEASGSPKTAPQATAFSLVNNSKLRDFHEILEPELAKSDPFYPMWP